MTFKHSTNQKLKFYYREYYYTFDERMRRLSTSEFQLEKQTFNQFIHRWNKNSSNDSIRSTISCPLEIHVYFWFQTDNAMIMLLSDGTLQVKYIYDYLTDISDSLKFNVN